MRNQKIESYLCQGQVWELLQDTSIEPPGRMALSGRMSASWRMEWHGTSGIPP